MNYTELLTELGIHYLQEGHSHCRQGWIQMDCPFCGTGSGKYHLGLNAYHGYFNCWQCGHQNLVETLSLLSDTEPRNIYPLLKGIQKTQYIEIPRTGKLIFPDGVEDLHFAHKRYLIDRKYNPDEITKLWGVKGIGIAVHLSWRLFIPIQLNYQTVSWTTRSIGDTKTRYISARAEEESINHKHLLYGEDFAHHAIIIVEGPIDAWRIGPGAVAILGLNVSQEQIARMSVYPLRVVCFDNTIDAQLRANKLAKTLSLFPGETYIAYITGKDVDVSPEKEVKELRRRFLK